MNIRDPTYSVDISKLKLVQVNDEDREQLEKDLDMFFRPKTDPTDMSKELRLKAEEDLNENPILLKDNIQLLRDMIHADPNLNGRIDDVFLCAFLRGKKHDVNKAFQCYRNAYEFKAKYPDFYAYLYNADLGPLANQNHFGSLPGVDKKQRKILVLIPGNVDLTVPVKDSFKLGTGYAELMLTDVHIQVTGIVVILDVGNMSIFQQGRLVTPTFAWHLTMLSQDKVPMRIKAVHIINQPFYFSAMYAIFKPFLKKKLRKRICLHGNNWASLHEHIAPEHLPQEYGGTRPPFSGHITNSIVELNEHKFKEWAEYQLTIDKK